MKIVRETENLHRLIRFGTINCFLVRESDGFTVVDTGLAGSASSILRAAQKLGSAIRRIVLTHAHIDHVGSVDALLRALPAAEFSIGKRESRLLHRDFTLEPGETGKALSGFTGAKAIPSRLLAERDRVGSLQAITSYGHTSGHFSFLDVRDNSLIAGDALTAQNGLVVAGVFKLSFPFPAMFSWNAILAVRSAAKLHGLNPSLLAVGHGPMLFSPAARMELALPEAYRQHPEARQP